MKLGSERIYIERDSGQMLLIGSDHIYALLLVLEYCEIHTPYVPFVKHGFIFV